MQKTIRYFTLNSQGGHNSSISRGPGQATVKSSACVSLSGICMVFIAPVAVLFELAIFVHICIHSFDEIVLQGISLPRVAVALATAL